MTIVSSWPGAKALCKAPWTSDSRTNQQQLETCKHQRRVKRMYPHLARSETLSKKLNFSPTFSLTSIVMSLIKFSKSFLMLRQPSSIFTNLWTSTWTRKKSKSKKNQRVAGRVHKLKDQEQLVLRNSVTRMFIGSVKMGMRVMIDLRLKVRDKGLR